MFVLIKTEHVLTFLSVSDFLSEKKNTKVARRANKQREAAVFKRTSSVQCNGLLVRRR
jgi:hypothetical protein